MTAGVRYGLGVALTAIGLVLASAGLVSLIDGGDRNGDVAPIALDESATDAEGATRDDGGSDASGDDAGDASGGTSGRGGVAIGPAGPAPGDASDVLALDDLVPTDEGRRTTAGARSTRDGDTTPGPSTPTADPVEVPVGTAGTPDVTDVSPDDVPTPVDTPPAPEVTPDEAPDEPAPGPDAPEPEDPPTAPAPAPTIDEVPVDAPVRGPASAGCDRGPDWPWAERAGNQGNGTGHGPPVGGCRGGSAVGAVATVLAAPTPVGVHWFVRLLFG